jgi:tetratricopeptide (TPR) repeat protein
MTVIVLLLGVLLGYLFHNSSSSGGAASTSSESRTIASGASDSSGSAVQPLLERLKDDPNDHDLLASIGNAYYDRHDYEKAVGYYQRYLEIKPQDVAARTDMGTAIWCNGNPDGAIRQYETALRIQPDFPNALFNTGIVKWQGKQDRRGALEAWQKLLTAHPDYPDRQKVEQLMQNVQAEIGQAKISLR